MAAQTRERIATEALRLFAERGYAGTSIAQIEHAAGLKPGAGGLYSHFASKQEVLEAAIASAVHVADSAYALHATFPLGDLRAELTVLVRGSLLLFDATGDWIRLRAREADHFPKLFTGQRDLSARAHRYLADWLKSKVAEGTLVEHDTDATAEVLFGSIANYWQRESQRNTRRPHVSRDQFIGAWVDLATRLAPLESTPTH